MKKIFKNNEEFYFNDLKKITGWSEYDLTFLLKNLLDTGFLDELVNNENGKIYYRISSSEENEYLTIQQRIENINFHLTDDR